MRTHAKYLFRSFIQRRHVFCKWTHHCPYKNERTLQPYSHAYVDSAGSPMYKALVVSDNHVTFLLDPLNKETVNSMGVYTLREYIRLGSIYIYRIHQIIRAELSAMHRYCNCFALMNFFFVNIWYPPPPPPIKKIARNSRKFACHCIRFRNIFLVFIYNWLHTSPQTLKMCTICLMLWNHCIQIQTTAHPKEPRATLFWFAMALRGTFIHRSEYFMQIHFKWQYENIQSKDVKTVNISHMMTSSNGNIFRVTGPFCGEFTGEFPSQRPVTRSFYVFFDLRLNKRLNKQSWGWWFEMPWHPLWRHCNEKWQYGNIISKDVKTVCIFFLEFSRTRVIDMCFASIIKKSW